MSLHLDWCSYQAAKYACENYHYARVIPAGKNIYLGVYEDNKFIGCLVFGYGTNKDCGKPFGLLQTQLCELTRVALTAHQSSVSQIVAIGIRLLRIHCPKLRLIISFSDPCQGHIGGIYQAGNWLYIGTSPYDARLRLYEDRGGRRIGWRSMSSLTLKKGVQNSIQGAIELGYKPLEYLPKHKYLYPLDEEMRKQIEPLRKPYPKKCAGSIATNALAIHAGEGGLTPTPALQ